MHEKVDGFSERCVRATLPLLGLQSCNGIKCIMHYSLENSVYLGNP